MFAWLAQSICKMDWYFSLIFHITKYMSQTFKTFFYSPKEHAGVGNVPPNKAWFSPATKMWEEEHSSGNSVTPSGGCSYIFAPFFFFNFTTVLWKVLSVPRQIKILKKSESGVSWEFFKRLEFPRPQGNLMNTPQIERRQEDGDTAWKFPILSCVLLKCVLNFSCHY